jgi:hypothetical protein
MINSQIPEISPVNPQIYNSEEVAKLYQDFFQFYSQDTSESKLESKEKFSEICKTFKIKCGFNDQTSLELVLKKVEENHEFAQFVINNLKTLFPKEYKKMDRFSEIFGASIKREDEAIPADTSDLDTRFTNIINNDKFENQKELTHDLIDKISGESLTEQSSTPATYEQNKAELFSIINPANPDSKKSRFPKFLELLKECSIQEQRDSEIGQDNFVLTEILKHPDFLQDLDCFEIKEIVEIYKKVQSKPEDLPAKTKLDHVKKLFKVATHKAVMGSASFELINPQKALTENDFDPTKLSALKNQLNIGEALDSEGLMKLFFTLKYFGEENNFISAINPQKISQNPLRNYNLKFNNEELKHLSVVRTIHPKKFDEQRDLQEVREDFFKKLEEGDRHFCTTFFRSEFFNNNFTEIFSYPADHGIVADWDLPNAGHFTSDFWSEHFSFPRSRRFEGRDVSRLREFGENRNPLTYALTQCRVTHHLLKFESNLNPETTFSDKCEEYLFDGYETYYSKSDICWFSYEQQTRSNRDQISDQTIFDLDGRAIRAGSKLLFSRLNMKTYSESNVYLNLSDINGLAVIGSDLNNFIDLFTETSLERKKTLEKSDKLDHEIDKIKWQREVFCKDIEKILEEKLKKLTADFAKLTDEAEGRCSPEKAEVLCKYSGAYFDFSLSSLLIDQEREFFDEHDQILSHSERLKMINPQNISIHLQSLIEKTAMDLEYVKALSSIPDPKEVEEKLQRDLKIYSLNGRETLLTKEILRPSNQVDLIKLFLPKEEDAKTTEKFKIFVQQLAFEGFYKTLDNLNQIEQSQKSFLEKQIDFIAKKLDIDLREQIDIGETKVPFESKVTPIKIAPQTRDLASPLPTQLTMGERTAGPLQQTAKFSDLEYQLNQGEIQKLLSAYRLQYSPEGMEYPNPAHQIYHNQTFGLDKKTSRVNQEDFNLELALNNAFKNLGSPITKYNRACDKDKKSTEKGRDIHDGHHALTTSYYAKELLNLYKEKRDLFSAEMQAQIAEFDNPQKIKDLEILSLMHDTARTHGGHDQDEHKNAFYVALRLREMSDPRFQGDTISEEGLKMITDLANKESKDEGKSLMSKLIQSADSLAILRCQEFKKGQFEYSFDMNECYQDFAKIEDESLRKKELTRLKVIGFLLQENEKRFNPPKFLEFSTNPFEEFSKDKKAQNASEIFKFEITHDQEGFNKLLKAGCVEYIQSNFTQEQIKIFYPQSKSFLERSVTFLGYSPRDFNAHIATLTTSSLSGTLVNSQPRTPSSDLRQASVQETQLTSSVKMV